VINPPGKGRRGGGVVTVGIRWVGVARVDNTVETKPGREGCCVLGNNLAKHALHCNENIQLQRKLFIKFR
jgi:hypothetical protein